MTSPSPIVIRSYLRAPDGGFVPVERAAFPVRDPRHIPGAIEMSLWGTVLLDQTLCDLVDQLWAYIANTTEELVREGRGETYFPDQPILFAMNRVGRGLVVVSVDTGNSPRRKAAANMRELLREFYFHGKDFFERMTDLVPENQVANVIATEQLRRSATSVGALAETD